MLWPALPLFCRPGEATTHTAIILQLSHTGIALVAASPLMWFAGHGRGVQGAGGHQLLGEEAQGEAAVERRRDHPGTVSSERT